MAQFTPEGLSIDTQTEIQQRIEADQRAEISSDLDLSTSSLLGQVNRLSSRGKRLLQEALAALWLAMDPDSAKGAALDRLSALTGTYRKGATRSAVLVTINVEPGTYPAGTLAAHPAGRPADRFTNAEDVVLGGAAAADVSAVFRATEPGPVRAPAGSLVIAGPVSGWNAIVSHPDADVGHAAEKDGALRLRRDREVAAPGSASVPGVVADVSRLAGEGKTAVEAVSAHENTGDTPDSDGRPPHSLEVVVFGPETPTAADNEAVAEAIFSSAAGGIKTHGNTTILVSDEEGQLHAISFTRPVRVDLFPSLSLVIDPETYAGDEEVKRAISSGAATLTPGRDVAGSQIAAWAHSVRGVVRVPTVTINGGPVYGTHAIGPREVARIASTAVSLTSTPES